MKYKVVSESFEIDKKTWYNFILENPNGNFFQSPKVSDFYSHLSGYEPITLFCFDYNGLIQGAILATIQKEEGFLKSKLSRRCIVYGGPILCDNNKEVTDLLLKNLIKTVRKKTIYIEFRNLFDTSDFENIFKRNGFKFLDHFNFIFKIDNPEQNFKKMNDSRRRQIKKSIEAGANIFEPENINEVKEFYLILKNLYKSKVNKPLPNFGFFENFFFTPELGKYFLIKYNNKIIGGIMCALYKDTIYEWYICGKDKEFKGIYPSVLATWAPIKYAAENGLKYFDFLGAGSTGDYGVREFKSKFGGEPVHYGRYIKINKPLLYTIGKLGLKILKKVDQLI